MKELFIAIGVFIKTNFNWRSHILVVSLLTVLTAINYSYGLEDRISEMNPEYLRPFVFFGVYSFVYFFSIWAIAFCEKKPELLQNKKLFYSSVFFLVLWSINMGFPYNTATSKFLASWQHSSKVYYAVFKLWVNVKGMFLFVLPVMIYSFIQKDSLGLGLRWDWSRTRPYFMLILLMFPLLIVASFSSDFQSVYPRYKDYGEAEMLQIPKWVAASAFELAYGSGFFTIEFAMRGVFVLVLSRFIGENAVLPMAALYLTVHFGKPLGETISSFFGGYALGILTLHSRNIYGGLIVHLGIAWLMEMLAFIQK